MTDPILCQLPFAAARKRQVPCALALTSEYNIEFRYHEVGLLRRLARLYNQRFRIKDALQESVLWDIRISLEIHLRDQLVAFASYIEVDMSWPDHARFGGIVQRFYRFELIAAIGAGSHCSEAFKIGVERCRVRVIRMSIASHRICLPYFDVGSHNRDSVRVDHASPDNEKLPLGASRAARNARQVAATVRPAHDRIKRAQYLLLCPPSPRCHLGKNRTHG